MRLLHVALKNVLRRRTRSALAAASVAGAVATTIALVGFSTGFKSSIREVYAKHHVDLVVVRAGVAEQMTSSLDESVARQIAELPYVKAVNPSLTDMVSFDDANLIGIPVHGWRPDGFVVETLQITDGQPLQGTDRRTILLGAGLAKSLGKQVGDSVRMENGTFRVAGVYRGINPYEDASAVVPLADLQAMLDRAGQVTEFQLMLDGPISDEQTRSLCGSIEALTDAHRERWGLTAISAPQYAGGGSEVQLADALAWATTAIAMLIGCVALWNTMHVSVLERTQEIGVLRAIGWHRRRIVWMIFCESEMIVLIGVAAGIALALLAVPLLAQLPAVRGLIQPDVAMPVVAIAAALATTVGMLASACPSFFSARLNMIDAMRRDAL